MNFNPYLSVGCYIAGTGTILWLNWLCLLLLSGTLITGKMQMTAAAFFFTQKGDRFSNLKDLELCFGFGRYKELIQDLSPKMKASIRWVLKIDYLFMFCLYILMTLLAIRILHIKAISEWWLAVWRLMRWVPFIVWIFDIFENLLTAKNLNNLSTGSHIEQLTSSLIKWLFGIIYFSSIVVFGIWYVIRSLHL